MEQYEYKVVPAPRRPKRVKGAKTQPDRFAHALTDLINTFAGEGWQYMRAETLPMDEKKGMLSSPTESYQSVLVFRRVTRPAGRAEPMISAQQPDRMTERLSVGPADRDSD